MVMMEEALRTSLGREQGARVFFTPRVWRRTGLKNVCGKRGGAANVESLDGNQSWRPFAPSPTPG